MAFRFGFRGLMALALAACGLAAPAQAATLLDFGNTSGQSNLGTTGPNGNVRNYTLNVAGTVVNVKVTGWSINGSTIQNGFLGAYSGWGLGVTNRDEGGSSPGHSIDDSGRLDFVALQFDREVIISAFGLTAVSGNDTDASFYFGTSGLFNAGLALHNTSVGALNALLDGGFNSMGGTSSRTASFNSGGMAGDLWIVTPYAGDKGVDLFKLRSAMVDVPAVPEPSTWLMMLIGFFATGAAMRQRPARATGSLRTA